MLRWLSWKWNKEREEGCGAAIGVGCGGRGKRGKRGERGKRGRRGDAETRRRGEGETGRGGDGETGRRGDAETGRRGEGETRRRGESGASSPHPTPHTPHPTPYPTPHTPHPTPQARSSVKLIQPMAKFFDKAIAHDGFPNVASKAHQFCNIMNRE